jgi:nucleotide-binding universal stress UspA family protein
VSTSAFKLDFPNPNSRFKTAPLFSFRHILFPVDFSRDCEAAVPYVADLVNRFQAKLTLLHAVDDSENTVEHRWRRHMDLVALAAQTAGGDHWRKVVTHGEPKAAIRHYAKSHGIDIVAMTPGASRDGIGSVTRDVLNYTSCAVWTERSTGRPHSRWSPVLCAVDLKEGSEQVLAYASALADQFCANLIAIHVIPSVEEYASRSQFDATRAEDLLQHLNIAAEVVTHIGPVCDTLCAAADRLNAQLLVIGRPARTEAGCSLAAQLVRSAPCPVVSPPRTALSSACFWTEWQQEDCEQPSDSYPFAAGAHH